ncbi:hypothetical protein [Micrococcus luteus]|uniref:hypothetical protein n=1 Tax=Micrococcus luteus TaxID=1270 RepID=UPI0033341538
MTRAAVLDQPTLWDDPTPTPAEEHDDQPVPALRRPTHTPRPRRTKASQAEPCEPTCLVCGKPEGRGLCSPRCSNVCAHIAQADLVEVCLVTVYVTARVVVGLPGAEPGRHLAVVTCPFCARRHWHAARYGRHYRTAHCSGRPYIVTLARPRVAPQVGLSATEAREVALDAQRATPAPLDASQAATAARGAVVARAALAHHTPTGAP